MYKIEAEGEKFVLYDDGYVYSTYATREEAETEMKGLIADDMLTDAVSEAVDDMMDTLRAKHPNVSLEKLKTLVVENLS